MVTGVQTCALPICTKPLAFGQVYSTLARLLRDGLIVQLGAQAGAGQDPWFQDLGYRVMPLPTGQGLVFKR